MTPLEKGEKVNQCQEDSSQLQPVYVPREELSCPDSARWSALEDHAPACQGCIRRNHLTPILTPLWRKRGFAILKGCKSDCATPWLVKWLVLWSRALEVSSTRGTASCEVTPRAAQGRLRPWGLRACDKCSWKHDGLTWSGPIMHWDCKKCKSGPDGPAFERNPCELPKTQFIERRREHSSWCSF